MAAQGTLAGRGAVSKRVFDKIAEGLREATEAVHEGRTVIFHRAEGWYPIQLLKGDDVAIHAELNPGTLKIEDALTGEILWSQS